MEEGLQFQGTVAPSHLGWMEGGSLVFSILSFMSAEKLPFKASWQWESEGLLVAMAIRKPQGWRNQWLLLKQDHLSHSLSYFIPAKRV